MRRVTLHASDGDAFQPAGGSTAQEPPPPSGTISMLVNRTFAKKFSIGDTFVVSFLEREED